MATLWFLDTSDVLPPPLRSAAVHPRGELPVTLDSDWKPSIRFRLRDWIGASRAAMRIYDFVRNPLLVRRQQRVLRGSRIIRRTVDGVTIDLDLAELSDFMMGVHLSRRGYYEPATTRLIRDLLTPGATFVDVGANIGYFSLLAERFVGPTGRVLSFEPSPSAILRFRRNIAVNGGCPGITLYEAALSDHVGVAPLYLSPLRDGDNSLRPIFGRSLTVNLQTLDAMRPPIHPDVIKIDVQGAELAVLRGMDATLRSNPQAKIIVEWDDKFYSEALWAFLTERFRVFRIIDDPSRPYVLLPLRTKREAWRLHLSNLLCIAKDVPQAVEA